MGRFITLPSLFIVLLFLGNASAQALPRGRDARHYVPSGVTGEILLPMQKQKAGLTTDAAQQLILSLSPQWQDFVSTHGPWNVIWNQATRTPHRAFGEAIPLTGYSVITQSNVRQAAETFLAQEAQVLGVRLDELKFVRATEANQRWYVSYQQAYQGVDVLLSEVELRLSADGRIMALGSDFYPDITVSVVPTVSLSTARQRAVVGLPFRGDRDRAESDGKVFILPVREGNNLSYHLVYLVNVVTDDPVGNYASFVDAQSGDVIWRHNRVKETEVRGRIAGMVTEKLPLDPLTEHKFPDEHLSIGPYRLVTDSTGRFGWDISSSLPLKTQFDGPWTTVTRYAGTNASVSRTVNPGDSLLILWDEGNSTQTERCGFYHMNFVHDVIKGVDPAFTALDYPLPCIVQDTRFVGNAAWCGIHIHLGTADAYWPPAALCPATIYHEYGHAVSDRMYMSVNPACTLGMMNLAVHEGMADANAGLILDRAKLFQANDGSFYPRTLDNALRYPDSVFGEAHHDGLTIGGAFWDVRLLTSRDIALHLMHFARYGTPDDLDEGVAFSEWYTEVLIADDDNGNLADGTPHFAQINQAFNKHGIGSALFAGLSYAHTPPSDTPDTLNSYAVSLALNGVTASGAPDSVFVHYSTDRFITTHEIPAMKTGNEYIALIPPQHAGTVVDYYFSARDPLSDVRIRMPAHAPTRSYSFLVGARSLYVEDFENQSEWLAGLTATDGNWEVGVPEQVVWNGMVIQPGRGHSPTGDRCYVTGGRKPPIDLAGIYTNEVDGATILFSPTFDLRQVSSPVVRYWKWYKNYTYDGRHPPFTVDITTGKSGQWTPVESFALQSEGWEKFEFSLPHALSSLDSVRFRFTATDQNGAGEDIVVEALLDDFEILGTGGTVKIVRSGRAAPGIMYAGGNALSTVELSSGAVTRVVGLNGLNTRALAVQPGTDALFAFETPGPSTFVYRLDTDLGYATLLCAVPVSVMRAVAFLDDSTLFGGSSSGSLVRVRLPTADTTNVRSFAGLTLVAFAIHPQTHEIWASAATAAWHDLILKIDPLLGDTIEVGRTGDNDYVLSLAFDGGGTLYGLRGMDVAENTIIRIDRNFGTASLVCSTHVSGLLAIAMNPKGVNTVQAVHNVPATFHLEQNYPNPFNPSTTIKYELPKTSQVNIRVYDMLGREVSMLVNERKEAGVHEVKFDGSDLASGVYFYRLQAGSFVQTRKLLLLR